MKFPTQEIPLRDGRTMTLREAQGSDAAQVLAYLNRVGGESDNLLFGENGFPMPVEKETDFLDRQRQETKSIMVAGFVGEELVSIASCDALTARDRVAHRAGLSVTVRKDFWGLGIGRKAMEALIAFAKDVGLEVLQLEVRADNERAVALYEHLGFEKMGLYKNFMKVNGQSCDAWYMNLYLNSPLTIRPVTEGDLENCLSVIHQSFATVAREFGLTKENCSTHTSFLPWERFRKAWVEQQIMGCLELEGCLVGFVSLQYEGDGAFELKHLAVLPQYRHLGYGEKMVRWVERQAVQQGGVLLKAGIIEESKVLKEWYCSLGFYETGTKHFPQLPFTVGFLEKRLQ
ncbi:MAG: GNAT family N-acetyltransferase [Acutalibacter sp.]|jgi:ribosomal protein S18 acetylase RimI-like enzyme